MKNTTIVMLGAGYTSLWAYKQLATRENKKKIADGTLKIIVISDRKHHYYHGFTGEVMAGIIPEKAIYTPLKKIMSLATVIKGQVSAISPFMKTVYYSDGKGNKREISYDQLVVACGSTEKQMNIDNATTNSIKAPKGLSTTKRDLLAFLRSTQNNTAEGGKKFIAIYGGGFTGVELATNIQELINRQYNQCVQVVLITRDGKILKEWQKKQKRLVRYTEKQLLRSGVRMISEDMIDLQYNSILILKDGLQLDIGFTIQAIGQQPNKIEGINYLYLNDSNRISTDNYLRANGHLDIWSGGDIAAVKHPFKSTECPSNALWAIMQGKRIGKNINQVLSNKAPKRFAFPGLGQTAAYGKGKAAMELYGIPIWGWTAYLMRIGFFLFFFPDRARFLRLTFYKLFANKKWIVKNENKFHRNAIPTYRILLNDSKI